MRRRTIQEFELDPESLLSAEIKDDELSELLERLAATEEMFKQPVSTIRDVAELTDISPLVIARILSDIRGPSEFERLHDRMDGYEKRLSAVERKPVSTPPFLQPPVGPVVRPPKLKSDPDWERYRNWMANNDPLDFDNDQELRRDRAIVFGICIFLLVVVCAWFGFMQN
ncbi:MAG: hypothetical protein JST12_08215 [Armatimonadetes bacterium]|nr:hypothetical protein [Armatimonadota bacterium]